LVLEYREIQRVKAFYMVTLYPAGKEKTSKCCFHKRMKERDGHLRENAKQFGYELREEREGAREGER
jgi:hypothetical protein